MDGYTITTAEKTGLEQITECFNLAFSDYPVKTELTVEQNRRRLERLGVDYSLCACAFYGEELVGFILCAAGEHCGVRAAYDAATGVVPAHRGRGLFKQMLGLCRERLAQTGTDVFYTEALCENTKALSLYESNGFVRRRELVWLTCEKAPQADKNTVQVKSVPVPQFDLSACNGLDLFTPSFENRTQALENGADGLYAVYDGQEHINALCIHDAAGVIYRLGARPEAVNRLPALAAGVYARTGAVKLSNIDASDTRLLKMLADAGFKTFARQYELISQKLS